MPKVRKTDDTQEELEEEGANSQQTEGTDNNVLYKFPVNNNYQIVTVVKRFPFNFAGTEVNCLNLTYYDFWNMLGSRVGDNYKGLYGHALYTQGLEIDSADDMYFGVKPKHSTLKISNLIFANDDIDANGNPVTLGNQSGYMVVGHDNTGIMQVKLGSTNQLAIETTTIQDIRDCRFRRLNNVMIANQDVLNLLSDVETISAGQTWTWSHSWPDVHPQYIYTKPSNFNGPAARSHFPLMPGMYPGLGYGETWTDNYGLNMISPQVLKYFDMPYFTTPYAENAQGAGVNYRVSGILETRSEVLIIPNINTRHATNYAAKDDHAQNQRVDLPRYTPPEPNVTNHNPYFSQRYVHQQVGGKIR